MPGKGDMMLQYKSALYVVTLAECGSIRSAAEKLYISPPALSMYIRNLEKEVGIPLFERTSKQFIPTEVGERYLAYSKKILALNQEFQKELNTYRRRQVRVCSIGIYRRRGNHFMVPLLQELAQKMPEIQFDIQIGSMQELEEMLESHQLDYMLVTHMLHKPGWEYLHVCGDELLVICPESMRKIAKAEESSPYPILDLAQLPHEKLISPGKKQSIYPFVERFLAEYGRDPATVRTVANMEIGAQLVSAGRGYCFTLASYRPSFAHIPGLLFCRPRVLPVTVNWSLGWTSRVLSSGQISTLKKIVEECTVAMTRFPEAVQE